MFGTFYNSLIGIMGARSLRARVPNNPRIIVDCNLNWVGVRAVLSNNNVGFASDSSDLQNALAVGLCYAPYSQSAYQRSSMGNRFGVFHNHRELSLDHSLGAVVRSSMIEIIILQ